MDQVHGFVSCVHGIVDQSRSLILIQAARILLKRKCIGDLIPALHLWADDSHHTRPTGVVHRSSAVAPLVARWGSAPELSGAWWRGVFGAKRHGGRRRSYSGRNTARNGSMMVRGSNFPPPSTGNGERRLRLSSGFNKYLNTFLVASSCF
jgi:hypothetical protein